MLPLCTSWNGIGIRELVFAAACFSETNPIHRSANRKKAEQMGALKISTESDDYIFDEIHRRDRQEDEEFKDEMEKEDNEDELEDE